MLGGAIEGILSMPTTWLVVKRLYIHPALACGALLLLASQTAAQAAPAVEPAGGGSLKVAVLRTTQGDGGAAAEAIDGALLRDLSAIGGIDRPTVSPIDYAEIQLTVGCSDEGRQCLSSIAQMVQVDAVVVRKLVIEPNRARLEIVYLDTTAADEPARAEQIGEGPDPAAGLAASVPSLVRRLFGTPEPVSAAAPEAEPSASHETVAAAETDTTPRAESGGVGPLTWVALGAGAAALGVGIALGVSANGSNDDYQNAPVATEEQRADALDKLDAAKGKGLAATILIPTGAALLALGATLLIIDLSGGGDESGAEMAVQPLDGGALLSLRTRAEGL